MAEHKPLVSIALPVRNCESTIILAMQSVVNQTYDNWECILIDDGSTDATLDIIRKFSDDRIRIYTDGGHKGIPTRLNEAIKISQGQYFARMDGDDIAYPRRIERQVDYLTTHPDVDLIGTWALVFGEGGRILGKRGESLSKLWRYRMRLKTVPIVHPTLVGRTEWFRAHTYQEWARHSQDQQLLVDNLSRVRLDVLPEILLGYREERLSIVKQARYRLSYIMSFPYLRQSSGLDIAIVATITQFAKLAIDVLAISTGLDYKLLKSRAMPVSPEDCSLWRQVWDSVCAVRKD